MVGGSGDHQVELVVAPAEISVYLLHDGKVDTVQGATVRASFRMAGARPMSRLTASGSNRLVGKLEAPLASGARVVISGRDNHSHSISARFVLP